MANDLIQFGERKDDDIFGDSRSDRQKSCSCYERHS